MDPLLEFALIVKAVNRDVQRRIQEAMAPLGITGPQADALVVIGQAGQISLTHLGDLLVAEGGHPSRLVDRLVEAGLVERRPADDDRRRIELTLTRQGHRVERQIAETREVLSQLASELIPPRDLEAALKALRKLVSLTEYAELVTRRAELEHRSADQRK